MYSRLDDVLNHREENSLFPFYWQRGDHYDKIPEQIEQIFQSGCRAFCVESRPHKDFCGETWWRDMDLILSEAVKRNMKVWILDDDRFPTGHAVGQVEKHPELRKWQLIEKHVDVIGPCVDTLLMIDPLHEDHQLLGVYAYPRNPNHSRGGDAESCRPEPINLGEKISDSFVQVSLPEGCWRVFFLYKTRQGGAQTFIDMLCEESVRLLIDAVYEPHYAHYAEYFGTTIAGFFSDEPSFGNGWLCDHTKDLGFYNRRVGMYGLALPWNDRVISMMRQSLGYDPLEWFPALWFPIGEQTGSIRHAYMDAVTKLYRDCFTRQLGRWCEEHGVEYTGHIIEDMNDHARLSSSSGHYFRALDGQHMSGIDIVLHQIIPGNSDYIHNCSAFGNDADPAFFDYVLAKLGSSYAHIGTKVQGRALCEVFGAYGWAEGTPCMKYLIDYLLVRGINRFIPHAFSPSFPNPDAPPHFGADGVDPQFEGFSRLMRYTNQAVHLLGTGVHHVDAAILYHAEAEWMNEDGAAMLMQVPAKILYDAHIDYDILPADCFVPGSQSSVYSAVLEDGKLVVGTQSYQCLIVPACDELPKALEKALGSLASAGFPVIRMQHGSEDALLQTVEGIIKRDITVEGNYPKLRCCHKQDAEGDIYMFVNESTTDWVSTQAVLHNARFAYGIQMDILNDSVSAIQALDGVFSITLAPYQSIIVVLDSNVSYEKTFDRYAVPKYCDPADFVFAMESAPYTQLDRFSMLAEAVSCDALFNITDIRRTPDFSGRIRYTACFEAKENADILDLGNVGQTCHLWLNEKDMGIRICPPYRYDLRDAIRQGKNELVIEVSNTLANAVKDSLSYHMPIPPSGLLGPVRWMTRDN